MSFSRKGQSWNMVIYLIAALVIMSIVFMIWENVSKGGLPSSPEDYVKAWDNYGQMAFKGENQPWRLVAVFFFPLIIYFSIFYFAILLTFTNIIQRYGGAWETISKPLIVFAFAVSFMILPTPFTYILYSGFTGLGALPMVFAYIVFTAGILITIYNIRRLFPSSPQTQQTTHTTTTPLQVVNPPNIAAVGAAPQINALPQNIQNAIQTTAGHLTTIANAINSIV